MGPLYLSGLLGFSVPIRTLDPLGLPGSLEFSGPVVSLFPVGKSKTAEPTEFSTQDRLLEQSEF